MTTLTPERIEEIRAHLQAAIKNGQPDGWREFEEMLLVRIEDHVLRGALQIVSAYDALSRDGMREALVKARIFVAHLIKIGNTFAVGEALLAEIDAALSPDAPRQKVG